MPHAPRALFFCRNSFALAILPAWAASFICSEKCVGGLLLFFFLAGSMRPSSAAFQRGRELQASQNHRQAIAEYQTALNEDPGLASALRGLGDCHYYLGEKGEALKWYEDYLAAVPGDGKLRSFVESIKVSEASERGDTSPASASSPPDFKPRYGFRGLFGYGVGLSDGGFGYGKVDAYTWSFCSGCYTTSVGVGVDVRNHVPYQASPGTGLAYGGELLYAFHPSLELGLGVFPLGLDAQATSAMLFNNYFASDKSSTKFQTLPALLNLYAKVPIWRSDLGLIFGVGAGYAAGGALAIHSDRSVGTGTPSPGTSDLTKSLDPTLAWRTTVGVEYFLNRRLSFMLGLSLLAARFVASEDKIIEVTTSSSLDTYQSTVIHFVDAPPELGSLSHVGPTTVGFTTTESWDDGRTKIHQTSTFDPVLSKTTFRRETETSVKKGLAINDLGIHQLSSYLGLTFRY